MTLLWFDGFEHRDLTTFYTVGGSMDVYAATRFSTGVSIGILSGSSERHVKRVVTASSQIFAGAAYRSTQSTGIMAFYGDSGATQHITICANATTGGFDVRRGTSAGTVVASSAGSLWQANSWYYLEAGVTINDTTGTVEVRLNGNPTPIITFTGDTKNAGTSTNIDAVSWAASTTSGLTGDRFDDVYACNSSGSSPTNTFLGDVTVPFLIPTGAGSTTGLTPSTGSNWQTVDETPAVATDYSGSATSGARDTYAITDLSSSVTTVFGVALHSYMHKSDAGAKSMKPAIKVGSTVYYGTTNVLNSSITRYLDIFVTSPDTGVAWTVSEVNASEIGAEVI